MEASLDNPVWHALNTGNRLLANGNEQVKYFSSDVSPFLGFDVLSDARFEILSTMIPGAQSMAFFATGDYEVPEPWKVMRRLKVAQMIYDAPTAPIFDGSNIVPLTRNHVPEMLELTRLTRPGPFFENTINFGDFFGIFVNDKLVAMTGERLKPDPWVEVSAVCTHPDHIGKGYAKRLLANQVELILKESHIPILHVLSENTGAIALYEKLGFRIRKEMVIHMIRLEGTKTR